MSDDEVDQELLALADDEDASEIEDKPTPASAKSKSASPSTSTHSQPLLTSHSPSPKGVAQAKPPAAAAAATPTPNSSSKSIHRRKDESEEEGEASSVSTPQNSLGSGAMSESDSDGPGSSFANKDAALFPIDGLFRSEKEKADINAMPEIQRERLLAERAEEAEQLAQSAKLRMMMKQREKEAEKTAAAQKKRKATSLDLDESPRKTNRAKTMRNKNLAEYIKKREQHHEQRKLGEARKSIDKKSPSQEAGPSDAEGDVESEVEWDDGGIKPLSAPDEPPPTLHDFERVRVGRTNFAKVCFYPGFDESIKGCFARVSIGTNKATRENTYRLTQIKGFVEGKPYVMEGPNRRPFHTNQYAILAHGKSEKEWPFIVCSDSKFTEAEFSRYLLTLSEDGMRVPTRSFLANKCADIQKLLDHRWTNEDVSNKMRRMNQIAAAATNVEREKLEKQRKIAQANNNETEEARLDAEIAALDGNGPRPSPARNVPVGQPDTLRPVANRPLSQQERLAAINRANRKANAEEIRKAQIEERRRAVEAQREAEARGETFSNPFARVKTRARVHHDANGGDILTGSSKKKDDLFGDGSDISRAATPANGTSRAGTPTPGTAKSNSASKGALPRSGEKVGVGGVTKKIMDDDVLGAMDLGIDIDI